MEDQNGLSNLEDSYAVKALAHGDNNERQREARFAVWRE